QSIELVHVPQQHVAGGAGGLDHEGDGGFLHGERPRGRWGKGWRGERAGRRWHDGVVAGRAVYHCPMNTEATPHEAGAPARATRGPDAALRLRIVLVGTQHPGNIGSAARALKTMGLARLVLVAPEKSPNAESSALAAGADDVLEGAARHDTLAEAVADCRLVLGCTARSRRVALEELLPRDAATRAVATATGGAEVALVFGRERT